MLLSLHIENVAVIKSIDIDFRAGFTALTGETGAGKSIIIDSINLLLGAKTDKELVRHGESVLMVSALFGEFTEKAKRAFSERGISVDDDGSLLIQRTVGIDGKTAIKINGRAMTLSILKEISSDLISVHGQSDTGSLLDESRHLELVDTFAENNELLEAYCEKFAVWSELRENIRNIRSLAAERERRREMLQYQINDIAALDLHPGEEDELVDKKVKIKNSEKIVKNSEFVYKALRGSDKGSVSLLLDKSVSALSQISGVVPEFADYCDRLREISYQINDIAEEVNAVIDDMETDPTEALNQIEDRLDKITKLKRKYGYTVEEILSYKASAEEELSVIENSDSILADLTSKELIAYNEAVVLADSLHQERGKAIAELEERVRESLAFLDMPGVIFYADARTESEGDRKRLDKKGYDKIEFYLCANKGAEAQPLSKVASGGELARVMLAIKEAIADKGNAETIIFDEIDSGVSGKTARKIGYKMQSLSKIGQVFCITHSAQIASLAQDHYLISKDVNSGATETKVRLLDYDGKVGELSRILGGINVTDSQRSAAVDLLRDTERK